MQYTQHLTIDVFKQEQFQYIHAVQFDHCARQLVVTPTANGEKLTIPSTATAVFRCLKHDGTSVMNPATVDAAAGTITFELTDQALACEGMARADVSIIDGESVISTLTFFIMVEKAATSSEQIQSANEFLFIAQVAAAVEGYTERAEAAAEKAANSEVAIKEAQVIVVEAIEVADATIEAAAEAKSSAESAAASETAAEAAQTAAEVARDKAQFFAGDKFSIPVAVTIPAGRMRGDVNGDGVIDGYDIENFMSSEYYGKAVDSTNIDSIACDINGDGEVDIGDESLIGGGGFKPAVYPEVTGNWQSNPNYETEEYQFYTDIDAAELTASSDALLIVSGQYSLENFKVTIPEDGILRVWIKEEMPACDTDAFVIYAKTGNGECMAMTTSIPANDREKKSIILADEAITPTDWTKKYGRYMCKKYEDGLYPHSSYKMKLTPQLYSEEEAAAYQNALITYDCDMEDGSNYIWVNGTTPTVDLYFHVEFIPR